MEQNFARSIALIGSGHVNAVGIALSLREAGWTGRIICFASPGALCEQYPSLCETMHDVWRSAGDLAHLVEKYAAQGLSAHVFLTDEIVLDDLEVYERRLNAAGAKLFPHSDVTWDAVTDRKKFYEFVTSRGLAKIPEWREPSDDPFQVFPRGFRARVWRSWSGDKKLPRGMNVSDAASLDRWHKIARDAPLRPEDWCMQRLLSTDPTDNISVCGWHDRDVQIYVTTRKIFQTGDNGRLVERIADNEALFATTCGILHALGFAGVFEMEFVKDLDDGEYRLIELNPRFWMQHRLVASLTDNALIKRHLGMRSGRADAPQTEQLLWIDSASLGVLPPRLLLSIYLNRRRVVFATPLAPLLGGHIRTSLAGLKAQLVQKIRSFAT